RSRISPTGSRTRASLSAGVRTAVSVTLESLFTESTVYYNQRSVGFQRVRRFRLQWTLSSQAGAYLPVSYLVLHCLWRLAGAWGAARQTLPYIAVRGSKSNNATAATEVTCDADQVARVLNPLQLKRTASTPLPRRCSRGRDGFSKDCRAKPDSVATPSAAQCTRRHRFNFTYTCGNTRCLPVVCRLGELSARMEPLRLVAFVTVGLQVTFVDGLLALRECPRLRLRPVLQSFNSDKPPPEEMDPAHQGAIYGGGALLGAAILGFIILLLALCTPFFQRRRREAREQQAAVAGHGEAKNNCY
uniref:ZP domain-containing protein n=1 Tax=Macrostomum lignano TaxID=282301 RepID=A0A1I8JNL5_9PLAT